MFDVTSDHVVCCSVEDAASVDSGEHNESESDGGAGAVGQQELTAPTPSHLGGPAPTLCHTQGTHSFLSSCVLMLSPVVIRYSYCPFKVIGMSWMSSFDKHSIISVIIRYSLYHVCHMITILPCMS